jgi:hypothetical protein
MQSLSGETEGFMLTRLAAGNGSLPFYFVDRHPSYVNLEWVRLDAVLVRLVRR